MDSVRYEDGRGFPILDDIQLTFTERKVYGIISTDEDDQTRLAQLLAGFFLPTAGEIHYGLESASSPSAPVSKNWICFQRWNW